MDGKSFVIIGGNLELGDSTDWKKQERGLGRFNTNLAELSTGDTECKEIQLFVQSPPAPKEFL